MALHLGYPLLLLLTLLYVKATSSSFYFPPLVTVSLLLLPAAAAVGLMRGNKLDLLGRGIRELESESQHSVNICI